MNDKIDKLLESFRADHESNLEMDLNYLINNFLNTKKLKHTIRVRKHINMLLDCHEVKLMNNE